MSRQPPPLPQSIFQDADVVATGQKPKSKYHDIERDLWTLHATGPPSLPASPLHKSPWPLGLKLASGELYMWDRSAFRFADARTFVVAQDHHAVWCLTGPGWRVPIASMREVFIVSVSTLEFRITRYSEPPLTFRVPSLPLGALHYWVSTLQHLVGFACEVVTPAIWSAGWAATMVQRHWRACHARKRAATLAGERRAITARRRWRSAIRQVRLQVRLPVRLQASLQAAALAVPPRLAAPAEKSADSPGIHSAAGGALSMAAECVAATVRVPSTTPECAPECGRAPAGSSGGSSSCPLPASTPDAAGAASAAGSGAAGYSTGGACVAATPTSDNRAASTGADSLSSAGPPADRVQGTGSGRSPSQGTGVQGTGDWRPPSPSGRPPPPSGATTLSAGRLGDESDWSDDDSGEVIIWGGVVGSAAAGSTRVEAPASRFSGVSPPLPEPDDPEPDDGDEWEEIPPPPPEPDGPVPALLRFWGDIVDLAQQAAATQLKQAEEEEQGPEAGQRAMAQQVVTSPVAGESAAAQATNRRGWFGRLVSSFLEGTERPSSPTLAEPTSTAATGAAATNGAGPSTNATARSANLSDAAALCTVTTTTTPSGASPPMAVDKAACEADGKDEGSRREAGGSGETGARCPGAATAHGFVTPPLVTEGMVARTSPAEAPTAISSLAAPLPGVYSSGSPSTMAASPSASVVPPQPAVHSAGGSVDGPATSQARTEDVLTRADEAAPAAATSPPLVTPAAATSPPVVTPAVATSPPLVTPAAATSPPVVNGTTDALPVAVPAPAAAITSFAGGTIGSGTVDGGGCGTGHAGGGSCGGGELGTRDGTAGTGVALAAPLPFPPARPPPPPGPRPLSAVVLPQREPSPDFHGVEVGSPAIGARAVAPHLITFHPLGQRNHPRNVTRPSALPCRASTPPHPAPCSLTHASRSHHMPRSSPAWAAVDHLSVERRPQAFE